MARDWLAKNNLGNRRVRKSDVLAIAKMIADGKWETTHQGIGFYDDGTLADGQHRLAAIAEADIPVWCYVTTGMPRKANHAIDRGITRTQLDSLHFLGMSADQKKVAICQCMIYQYQAERMGREGWSPAKTTSERFSVFYERFSDAIAYAMGFGASSRFPAPAPAAVATAWFTQDRERLGEFMLILDEGKVFSSADGAAIKIRDYLKDRKYGFGTTARNDLFLRCCSALRYFLAGKNLTRLYATSEHAFKFADAVGEVA
jgi:hypothetical protein